MEISNYNFSIIEVVKFREIDIMGVCNNAVYFSYFEDARIAYLQNLKTKYNLKTILEGNSFFIMANNNCDYIKPSFMHDELNIYTRIEFIKNSSFGFKHIVENNKTKEIIAKGSGIFVHINKNNHTSNPLPEEFYKAVNEFDPLVKIIKK
ncbi:MAG: thioesterase family protein [bacterium]